MASVFGNCAAGLRTFLFDAKFTTESILLVASISVRYQMIWWLAYQRQKRLHIDND